ncbi:uncharacterized protein TNIN_278971 [Trichonephila inaurata madagascariensis]|uniref:Uncharacterized protein n=1 Tax=Trichonephila inaurata madagascariensis TaxID=2747483 RepID=A0A8X6WPY6_9ARAC|nr:uncharacterized protein TNIN_278971 [Trichonephila inaurata madagascariensis]
MKIKAIFVLLQLFLIIEKVTARTLFRDERLYPVVKDFENNFLSIVLSDSGTCLRQPRIIEIINYVLESLPNSNELEYEVIKSYSANFAFSALQKLNEKLEQRSKTAQCSSSTYLFRVILQAFKKARKITGEFSRLSVFTYPDSFKAEAPEQQPTSSNSLHDYDFFRSFTSLLKDRVFVESSDITSARSKSNHVTSKGFMRTLPIVVNKTVKSSNMHANSINNDRIAAVFSNNLHHHLVSSKLFNLVFRSKLPGKLAKEYTICFAASLRNVKEFSLLDASTIAYFFEEDINAITHNNTEFYSKKFSNKILELLKENVYQINYGFKSFDSNVSKNIINSFSNSFFHDCEAGNLEIYTSTDKFEDSSNFLKQHLTQFQLEFSYCVSLELVKIFEIHLDSDKNLVILALESTLHYLFDTFSISESLFLSAFDKLLLPFKEYSSSIEFVTFIVLDITQTLSNIASFHELASKKQSILFTRTFLQKFQESLTNIKNHVSDLGDEKLRNNKRKHLHYLESNFGEYSQTYLDNFPKIHVQRDLRNIHLRHQENSHKEWNGAPLLFAKRVHRFLLSSKLLKHVFYHRSKHHSRFCAFVITFHLSDILDFDIVKMLSLSDLFTEILWSNRMTKDSFAQNFAVQSAFWFDFNGILSEHNVVPFSSFIVDSVLKDLKSCNILEPDCTEQNHHVHKREVAFSIQIDNETLSPPISSNSPEFQQKHIHPLMKVDIPSNKIMGRSQSIKKEMHSEQTNDSESSTSLKDSLKSLLYYNLKSSSVFKDVMNDNLASSCANIYAQGIARSLLNSPPWTNLNESNIISGILQEFPYGKEKQTSAYYADIFASRISDLAEKNSLIEKNRLNEVATATANSITSYLTKNVYNEKNSCRLDVESKLTNNTINEKQFSDTTLNSINNKQNFKYQTNSVNHSLISISKNKINSTFPSKEPNSSLDDEKNNTNSNLTDTLPLQFANILQKNLLSSDIFIKAFYDGLPFPVASAYAFSMAKSLSSCPELKMIDKSEFSVAFETALNAIGNASSLQLFSEIFSSQISKLLGRKGLLEEATIAEKADIFANEMIRGLPIETLSTDSSSYTQNFNKDISMKNSVEETRHLKNGNAVIEESSVTHNQIEFSKYFRNRLKNCTNLTSIFYTGFPRDKAMRYFFEMEDLFSDKLNLSKPLASLFNQDLERDVKLLNEYPKTEDYINFFIMKITWLFTNCGIINEIEPTKLSQIALDVILLALYRERPDVDYCLEFGMAHEKGNVLILGELLCHKLISSKSFKNSFRSITPREIAAAYVFSMAESLLKDFKFVPESAMSVAFVKGMFAVKQNPSTKKYAAAFAYEIAHVFDSYDALSWNKIRENVESISEAMLSGLPADSSNKVEKLSGSSMYKTSSSLPNARENFTFVKVLENRLVSSEIFNKTFNTSISLQESFELAELVSLFVTNVSESKIVGNLAYALPYYVEFTNQLINRPVDYAQSISVVSFKTLKELNGLTEDEVQIAKELANSIISALFERNNKKSLQSLENVTNCSSLLTHLMQLRKNNEVTNKLKKKMTEICSKVISEQVYYNFMSSKLFRQFFSSIRFEKYSSNVMNRLTNCITNSSTSSITKAKLQKESLLNALKIAKYNTTIEVFTHSLSNETTIFRLDTNASDVKGVIPTATSLSNIVLMCISGLRRKEKSHAEKYQNSHYPRSDNNTLVEFQLEQVDLNSESSSTDNEPNSNDTLSILTEDFDSSNDAETLEILKLLRLNQELLSLSSQSLQSSFLIFNTKEKDAMRIENMKKEKAIVLFYRLLLYNLRTSRAFQSNLLQDLKLAPLKSLVLALSKYIVNISDFSSISEQHIFQIYNSSLLSIKGEMDLTKLATELSLTTTNLLLYYDLLDSSKLISQAALASIAINKAIFYVLGKVNAKHNLNTAERAKQIDKITDTKISALKSEAAIFTEKNIEEESGGSEELLFNEILFSGLSSSRLFSKVFNSDLTNDSATECFPQLAKQLSKVMKHCFIRRKYMSLYQNIISLTQRKANTTDYVKIFTHFFYQILKFSECAESEKLSYQAFDMFNALSIGLSRCLQLKDRISSKKYVLADNNQAAITVEKFLFNFCSSSHLFCEVFNPWLSQTHAQLYGHSIAKVVSKAHVFSAVLKKFLIYTYVKELKKTESVSCPVYAKMFSVHTTNVLRKYITSSRAVFQASVTFAAISKGIQRVNYHLSQDYSMPLSNVTSFNLFWDNFGEVDEISSRTSSNNSSTAAAVLKEKENKALSSNFTKLLNYNLMSSKIFIRSFNNNTTDTRASKCAFAIANSINDVINATSLNTDLIQAFDIFLNKLPGSVSTKTYATMFSSTVSDIFSRENILIPLKLQPLSVNISYAINAALFKVSSMTTLQRKVVHETESINFTKPIPRIKKLNKLNSEKMYISQQALHREPEDFPPHMLFEKSLKYFLLSSDTGSKYLRFQQQCPESRIYAEKMAELVKNFSHIDSNTFQYLTESYDEIFSSVDGNLTTEDFVQRIANVTTKLLMKEDFLDPFTVIFQAAQTSNVLNSAFSANISVQCSNETQKGNSSTDINASDIASDVDIFGKVLHYNLKSFVEYFLKSSCSNFTEIYAEEIGKSLVRVVKKIDSQDQYLLIELLKKSLTLEESNDILRNISSLISNFLKLRNFLIAGREINQASVISHILKKAMLRSSIKMYLISKNLCLEESGIPTKVIFKESLEHNLLSTKMFLDFFGKEREVSDLKTCSLEISESLNSIIHMNIDDFFHLQKNLTNILLQIRSMKSVRLYAHVISLITAFLYDGHSKFVRNRVVAQAAFANYVLTNSILQCFQNKKSDLSVSEPVKIWSPKVEFVQRKNDFEETAENFNNPIPKNMKSSLQLREKYLGKNNLEQKLGFKGAVHGLNPNFFEECLAYNLLSSNIKNKVTELQSRCGESSLYAFKISESIAKLTEMDSNSTQTLANEFKELLNPKYKLRNRDQLIHNMASVTSKILKRQRYLNSPRLIAQAAITANTMTRSISNASLECMQNDKNEEYGTKVQRIKPTSSDVTAFKKYFLYNLKTHTPLIYFLEIASDKEIMMLAKAISKSVTNVLRNTQNQDENSLSLSLKKVFTREKAKPYSHSFDVATSSVITSFLKEKNYLVDERLVTQAAIVSNALNRGILIAILKPNSFSKSLSIKQLELPVQRIFQKSLEHNLRSSRIFKDFFCHKKEISDLKVCIPEITKSLKYTINLNPDRMEMFEEALKNVLLQVKTMESSETYARAISAVVTYLFENQNILEKNRVILQAASTGSALLEGINRASRKLHLKKYSPLLESSIHVVSTDCKHSLRKKFDSALTYNMLSSKIFNILKYTRTTSEINLCVEEMSRSIANLINKKTSAIKSLAAKYRDILSFPERNKSLESYVTEISSVTTTFLCKLNYLVPHRLTSDAAIVSNSLYSGIVKVLRKRIENSHSSRFFKETASDVLQVDKKLKCYLTFRKIFHYNLMSFTTCKNVFSSYYLSYVNTRNVDFIAYIVSVIAELTNIDNTKTLELIDTFKDILRSFPMKANLNPVPYVISSITAEEFCQNKDIEFSRLVYETVSASKILCDKVAKTYDIDYRTLNLTMYRDKINLLKEIPNGLVSNTFETTLYDALSSSILQTFYLCECNRKELSQLAQQLSEAILGLNNSDSSKRISLKKIITEELSISNNKCAKLNLRNIAFRIAHFSKTEGILRNNDINSHISNFRDNFKRIFEFTKVDSGGLSSGVNSFPLNDTRAIFNYCQTDIFNKKHSASIATERETIKNSHLICERFIDSGTYSPEDKYISLIYQNLKSLEIFKATFKPGTSKEKASHSANSIAVAIANSRKCNTANEAMLERFFKNAFLFLPPNDETEDFACSIALTTSMACYEPNHEREISLNATVISDTIRTILNSNFLKTELQSPKLTS